MQSRSRSLALTFAMCGLPAAFAVAQDPARELHRLFDEYYDWQMREFPAMAMSRGDYSNAHRITDAGIEAIERRHQQTVEFRRRLLAIDRDVLSDEDRLNYDLFDRLRRTESDAHRFRMFLAPIGSRSGPHQTIPQMAERVRFRDYDDYANYLSRLEQVPQWIDQVIERLAVGLTEGRTPPRVTIRAVPEQIQALLRGDLGTLRGPLDRMPNSIPHERQAQLIRRFDENAFPAVREALGRLGHYLADQYIPNCRTTIAATDLPDGDAYYSYRLESATTTEMSATEIHELGLREVRRIKAEMMGVIRRTDFLEKSAASRDLADQELFEAFIGYLRTAPRFYHDSPDSLLRDYRDICKRIDAELPKLFSTLPRLPYGVREIPAFMAPNQTTAYYQYGDIRNAQPGWFYANTYALDQRPKYEMIALAMHEAVPGHHLQVALAQELRNVPEFRKHAWVTAFGEGWALYSERLGIEMGMYQDPYDDFGRLLYEMWRACRLVVDTGMHFLDWPRTRAVRFMLDNTALSRLNINNEIDRYINWPAQATAYKIGELRIRALRDRAEQTLGPLFDIREFHDVVLGAGPLPLDILETRVSNWIAKTARSANTRANER